jgi:hypothetical protein
MSLKAAGDVMLVYKGCGDEEKGFDHYMVPIEWAGEAL